MRPIGTLLVLCATLALAAAPAQAVQRPGLVLGFGHTLAVAGDPGDGGVSASLSAMWDLEGPWSAGIMAFADDMGSDLGRLRDANDGVDIGTIETNHRFAYGAAWRVDAALPSWRAVDPYVSTSWGAYRVQDDARGVTSGAFSSTGLGLGAGARIAVTPTNAFGVTARWHNVFRGAASHWLGVGAEWKWKWGGQP